VSWQRLLGTPLRTCACGAVGQERTGSVELFGFEMELVYLPYHSLVAQISQELQGEVAASTTAWSVAHKMESRFQDLRWCRLGSFSFPFFKKGTDGLGLAQTHTQPPPRARAPKKRREGCQFLPKPWTRGKHVSCSLFALVAPSLVFLLPYSSSILFFSLCFFGLLSTLPIRVADEQLLDSKDVL
jgi:hypothetical protein